MDTDLRIDTRNDEIKCNLDHEEVEELVEAVADHTLYNEVRDRVDTEDLITEIISEPSTYLYFDYNTLLYSPVTSFSYRETIPALDAIEQVDNFPPAQHYQYINNGHFRSYAYEINRINGLIYFGVYWNGRRVVYNRPDPRPFGYFSAGDGNYYFIGEQEPGTSFYRVARLGSEPVITTPGRHARAESISTHGGVLPYNIPQLRTNLDANNQYRGFDSTSEYHNVYRRNPFVYKTYVRQGSHRDYGVRRTIIIHAVNRVEGDIIEATVQMHPSVDVTDRYSVNPNLTNIDSLSVAVDSETKQVKLRYRFKGNISGYNTCRISFGPTYSETNLNYNFLMITRTGGY